MTTHELVLSGWYGGSWGLRVHARYTSIFDERRERLEQEPVVVDLPGMNSPIRVRLSSSFWRRCPEIRSAMIGRWMRSRGDAPWENGRPPRYRASLTVGREIVLRLTSVEP